MLEKGSHVLLAHPASNGEEGCSGGRPCRLAARRVPRFDGPMRRNVYAVAGFVEHSGDGGAEKGSRAPVASQVRLLTARVLRGGWRPNRLSTNSGIYVACGSLNERVTVSVSTWVEQRFGSGWVLGLVSPLCHTQRAEVAGGLAPSVPTVEFLWSIGILGF